jgi:hypothetical protein
MKQSMPGFLATIEICIMLVVKNLAQRENVLDQEKSNAHLDS